MNCCYVSQKKPSSDLPAILKQLDEHADWTHVDLPQNAIQPLWKSITEATCTAAKSTVERLDAMPLEAIVVDDFEVLATLTLAQLPTAPIFLLLPETLTRKALRLLAHPLMQAACQLTYRVIAPNEAVQAAFSTAIHWQEKDPRFLPEITPFNVQAPLFAASERTRLLPAAIAKIFREGKLEFIGGGTRRQCYRLPNEKLCIKCYRLDVATATRLKPSVRAEIARMRHSRSKNTSCQEYDYFKDYVSHQTQKVIALFPTTLELFYLPACGWTLIEELLQNYDDTYSIKSEKVICATSDQALRKAIVDAVIDLKDDILKCNIKLYDPQNLLVQFTAPDAFQLRLTDFEPSSRALIKLEDYFSSLAKQKTTRRYNNFIERISQHLR